MGDEEAFWFNYFCRLNYLRASSGLDGPLVKQQCLKWKEHDIIATNAIPVTIPTKGSPVNNIDDVKGTKVEVSKTINETDEDNEIEAEMEKMGITELKIENTKENNSSSKKGDDENIASDSQEEEFDDENNSDLLDLDDLNDLDDDDTSDYDKVDDDLEAEIYRELANED